MNAPHEPLGECPSRLRFDRLLAGELDASQAERLEQHASGCVRCGPLLTDLRRGRDAFSQVVPDAIVRRVHEPSARRGALRAWSMSVLAAAALMLAYLAWPKLPPTTPTATVRSKGGVQLAFYVQHDGAVRPGTDGERVQPGDKIEFRYTSERDAYIAIVSIDSARKASVYYADRGRAAEIRAASGAVLDRSTLLDDTLGPETVYALVCAQPIAIAPLLQALARAPEQAPAAPGCSVERYVLLKVPR